MSAENLRTCSMINSSLFRITRSVEHYHSFRSDDQLFVVPLGRLEEGKLVYLEMVGGQPSLTAVIKENGSLILAVSVFWHDQNSHRQPQGLNPYLVPLDALEAVDCQKLFPAPAIPAPAPPS